MIRLMTCMPPYQSPVSVKVNFDANGGFFTKGNEAGTFIASSTKKITKLKKGKTYYIKVRAYKMDSQGNKVYGSYSKIKKIKIIK